MFVTNSKLKNQVSKLEDENFDTACRILDLQTEINYLKNEINYLKKELKNKYCAVKSCCCNKIFFDGIKCIKTNGEVEFKEEKKWRHRVFFDGIQLVNLDEKDFNKKNDFLTKEYLLGKCNKVISKQISFNLNQTKFEFKEFIIFSTSHPNIFEVFFHGAFIKTIGTISEFKEAYKFFEGEEL